MIIIFSGYNPRAVISFLRTLEKNKIIEYGIIAASESDPIFLSSYATKVIYTRREKQLSLDEIGKAIQSILKKTGAKNALIIPSTEALNRFLLHNREYFEALNCIIPLVKETLYEMLSDKEKFWDICKNEGLTVPSTYELKNEFEIPFVAKPKKYISDKGKTYSPVLVCSREEYENFKNNYEKEAFSYQEFIPGESLYLLYYINRDGNIYKFSQENYAQQANGKSMLIASCSSIHDETISECYEKLLKKLGFKGLVMIELRKNKDEFYMIEANPRLWGPSQLFCDAGYNFFEFLLCDYGYLKDVPEQKINYDAKYLWSGGFNGEISKDTDCVWYRNRKEEVLKDIQHYCIYDIYNREDTKRIFMKEGGFL